MAVYSLADVREAFKNSNDKTIEDYIKNLIPKAVEAGSHAGCILPDESPTAFFICNRHLLTAIFAQINGIESAAELPKELLNSRYDGFIFGVYDMVSGNPFHLEMFTDLNWNPERTHKDAKRQGYTLAWKHKNDVFDIFTEDRDVLTVYIHANDGKYPEEGEYRGFQAFFHYMRRLGKEKAENVYLAIKEDRNGRGNKKPLESERFLRGYGLGIGHEQQYPHLFHKRHLRALVR